MVKPNAKKVNLCSSSPHSISPPIAPNRGRRLVALLYFSFEHWLHNAIAINFHFTSDQPRSTFTIHTFCFALSFFSSTQKSIDTVVGLAVPTHTTITYRYYPCSIYTNTRASPPRAHLLEVNLNRKEKGRTIFRIAFYSFFSIATVHTKLNKDMASV